MGSRILPGRDLAMAHANHVRDVRSHAYTYRFELAALEPLLAWLALVLGLFASTGVLLPLLYVDEQLVLSESDMAVMRLTLTPFMALVPVVALIAREQVADAMAKNGTVMLLIALSALSILWSVNPEVTTRRVISLAIFTLYAFWAQARFGFALVLRTMAEFLLVCLLGSVLMAILFPHLGVMPGASQLRGLFTHKNVLGQILVLSVLTFLIVLRHGLMLRSVACGGLLLALAMTAMVDSATSLSIILILLGAALALWWCSLPPLIVGAGISFAVAVAAVIGLIIVIDAESLFALVGRDATLTGRTELWAFAWRAIEARPWLGYGYQAFWTMDAHWMTALQTLNWRVPNAHSGYLELWLSTGILGLTVGAMTLLSAFIRGVRAIVVGQRPAGEFLVLLVLAYGIHNASESDLLGHTSLFWVALVVGLSACPWTDLPAIARRSTLRTRLADERVRPGLLIRRRLEAVSAPDYQQLGRILR